MSEPHHNVQDMKPVWVAWTNTDTTEGRGWQIPLCICDLKTTAERLGVRASVQGSDAAVEKSTAYKIDGVWFGVVHIEPPTVADEVLNKSFLRKQSAIERARLLGMSETEIESLTSNS